MRGGLSVRRCTAILILSALGCAQSVVSAPTKLRPLPEKIESVALAPGGGLLADAIGTELFNQGIRIVDTQQMTNLMVREGLNELEIVEPKGLAKLRESGVSAVLSVKSANGYDDRPQSASVRVVSTLNGELIAAANWQNGRGGANGSPADRSMRKDLVGAAQQIVSSLVPQLER